jgi:2-C-methyl-D-erythritol 4-phosphate cytidylyltransferase
VIKKYWAVIPAAGVGQRMGSQIPKQYLPLAGSTVLQQTLTVFLQHKQISGVIVAITEGDPYWPTLMDSLTDKQQKSVVVASGGKERSISVLNALTELMQLPQSQEEDWVLVHDAARPCLQPNDIDRLIEQLRDGTEGGLLGLPMADTVKCCDSSQQVLSTVDRRALWRALTPQMFPLQRLKNNLEKAIDCGDLITDEASAMELQGGRPKIVEGQPTNIKITYPADLSLAELFIINARENK